MLCACVVTALSMLAKWSQPYRTLYKNCIPRYCIFSGIASRISDLRAKYTNICAYLHIFETDVSCCTLRKMFIVGFSRQRSFNRSANQYFFITIAVRYACRRDAKPITANRVTYAVFMLICLMPHGAHGWNWLDTHLEQTNNYPSFWQNLLNSSLLS